MKHTRRCRPFTLIELLMVIAIIAVLMGMLLPTIKGIMEKAKRTQAISQIKALETAIKMYETTYGYLPWYDDGDTGTAGVQDYALGDTDYQVLIGYLQNSSADADGDGNPDDNPRGIRMLEVDNDQGLGNYEDPWNDWRDANQDKEDDNTTDFRYRIKFDTNYDGEVAVSFTSGSADDETVYGSVAIWSLGKKRSASDYKDNLKSWKRD